MSKMQRDKGKAGEREVVNLLKNNGFEARRGQQFKGTKDSPDVIHNIPGVHLEVKRREALSLYPALEKARDEAHPDMPVVFHRRNGKPWVAIMYADDFLLTTQRYPQDGIST
tara:strand:+ start:585 stop:920 length:336 start_codon:yes stop_codon:yes gene_type:complete